MQSGLVYGKAFIAQAKSLIRPICSGGSQAERDVAQTIRLITAHCGFGKEHLINSPKRKFVYGEDACFVTENHSSHVLGIADGVGGWHDYGIDSSKFSSTLMNECKRFVTEGGLNKTPDPARLIKSGYEELSEHKSPLFGSSTACIVVVDKVSQTLQSANIGDSGFLIIRSGAVIYKSEDSLHYFNTPYQLALPPPELEGTVIQDSPDEVETTSVDVLEGDVIVMGTDGLFDNLSTKQIVREIQKLQAHSREALQTVANAIAAKAKRLSDDPKYLSPFAVEALKEGIRYTGGKPDDITVLISVVSKAPNDELNT